MLRATSIVRKAAVKADKIIDIVTLDHDDRQKRRVALKGEKGIDLLLDLDKTTMIGDGDALKLEDGRLVAVRAAPEKLLKITAESALRLTRIAWHIGNRHTPAEIGTDAIYIGADHVLAEMVRGQGGLAEEIWRPFAPERGAYDHAGHEHGSHDHGHDHGHHNHGSHDHGHDDHKHDHSHGHEKTGHDHHDHKHEHAHDHDHAHGADCGCGHDHHHGHEHHHEHLEKPKAATAGHDHDHDHHHGHSHAHKHGH
ncbi:MAG: urease accessory protein UreE [Bosea sp. (in: a-proteobacteria)]